MRRCSKRSTLSGYLTLTLLLNAQLALFRGWRSSCLTFGMWTKIARLFVIKTKFEAFLIIYSLATGAVERGIVYLHQYPGFEGKMLFSVCPVAVFMAGARILDSIERAQFD
jgi:hypothetical protein